MKKVSCKQHCRKHITWRDEQEINTKSAYTNFPMAPRSVGRVLSSTVVSPFVFWMHYRVSLSLSLSLWLLAVGRSETCWGLLWKILMTCQQCKDRRHVTKRGQQPKAQHALSGTAGDTLSLKAAAEKDGLFMSFFFHIWVVKVPLCNFTLAPALIQSDSINTEAH